MDTIIYNTIITNTPSTKHMSIDDWEGIMTSTTSMPGVPDLSISKDGRYMIQQHGRNDNYEGPGRFFERILKAYTTDPTHFFEPLVVIGQMRGIRIEGFKVIYRYDESYSKTALSAFLECKEKRQINDSTPYSDRVILDVLGDLTIWMGSDKSESFIHGSISLYDIVIKEAVPFEQYIYTVSSVFNDKIMKGKMYSTTSYPFKIINLKPLPVKKVDSNDRKVLEKMKVKDALTLSEFIAVCLLDVTRSTIAFTKLKEIASKEYTDPSAHAYELLSHTHSMICNDYPFNI